MSCVSPDSTASYPASLNTPEAYDLYEKWKTNQEFQGTRLRAIQRDGRTITEVPDGIVFPILAALSAFAQETSEGWRIVQPELFEDRELIENAKNTYQEMADSNPQTMGKSKACYASLYQQTSFVRRYTTKVQ